CSRLKGIPWENALRRFNLARRQADSAKINGHTERKLVQKSRRDVRVGMVVDGVAHGGNCLWSSAELQHGSASALQREATVLVAGNAFVEIMNHHILNRFDLVPKHNLSAVAIDGDKPALVHGDPLASSTAQVERVEE